MSSYEAETSRWHTLRNRKVALLAAVAVLSPVLLVAPLSAVTIDTSNDVDIVQVEFDDNGTPVIQTSSAGMPLQSGSTPAEISQITIVDGSQTLVLDEYNVGNIDVQNIVFPSGLTGVGT